MPAGDAAAGRDAGEPLEDLAAREPLCLGPVLLHRALHRLLTGDPRTAVEPLFGRAAEACGRLRRSLQRTGTDDGDTEDVAWVARAEELVCAAERGAPDVPERFDALGPAPGDTVARRDGLPLRTEWYRRRLFVSLVNAKRLEDADCFTAVVAAVERRAALPGTVLADDELDVLFCGAMRELQRARGKGAAERTFELLSPRNKSAAERAFEMLPPRGKRAAERALELLRPSEEAAAASGQPAAQRALELLRRLRVACDAARAAGCTGSAERLVEPARNAELLAIEILGQRQERGMALAEPAGNAGRQTPNR